jgi:ribosomal protein S18 acetylase RimI-like enzyme
LPIRFITTIERPCANPSTKAITSIVHVTKDFPYDTMLSKDLKQKLKKLKAAKYIPTKGIESNLFVLGSRSSPNEEPLEIHYKIAPLSPNRLQDCMVLFEENMGALYKASSWGLDLAEKRRELDDMDARFLLVHDRGDTLVGYCHFRFDTNDDDDPTEVVVYVYELQVAAKFQRLGIGHRLMELVHQITLKAGLSKVMLTVFNSNEAAAKFYRNLGYLIDDTSPSHDGAESDYEIMCRNFVKWSKC